ncbi:unnamed protein product [Owenia fusiformis]|uniref:Uncharacterized protein n=1 Tax=Owenia fusiformis TaxID=6347 RepID=A0A8J1THW9_OWEFU|nr:unnamed protein product [Owenia fusiformis]
MRPWKTPLVVISFFIYIIISKTYQMYIKHGKIADRLSKNGTLENILSDKNLDIGNHTDKRQFKHFLILSEARSGSTYLQDLINKHSHLTSYDELLSQVQLSKFQLDDIRNKSEYILRCIKPDANIPGILTGFKVFISQLKASKLELKKLMTLLENPAVIVLQRCNLLDQYISLVKATRTQQWTSQMKGKTERSPFNLDIENFENYATSQNEHWKIILNELKSYPYVMYVTYDDILQKTTELPNAIFTFLGYPSSDKPFLNLTSFKRQRKAALEDTLDNYEDVKDQIVKWEESQFNRLSNC